MRCSASRGIALALWMTATSLSTGCFEEPTATHGCADCLECEQCVEGEDGLPVCEATAHHSLQCVGDAIHWFDSCGNDEGLDETCPEHAGCVEQASGDAECVCLNQWTGPECDVCPLNWDVAADCAECLGNWDEETDCAFCANHWVDEGNDCGTCPGNWDATYNCMICLPGWSGSDCETQLKFVPYVDMGAYEYQP